MHVAAPPKTEIASSGRTALEALLAKDVVLLFGVREAAERRADPDADVVARSRRRERPHRRARSRDRGDRELREAVGPAQTLGVDERPTGSKSSISAAMLRGERRRIEARDRADADVAGEHARPRTCATPMPSGEIDADAGDDDAMSAVVHAGASARTLHARERLGRDVMDEKVAHDVSPEPIRPRTGNAKPSRCSIVTRVSVRDAARNATRTSMPARPALDVAKPDAADARGSFVCAATQRIGMQIAQRRHLDDPEAGRSVEHAHVAVVRQEFGPALGRGGEVDRSSRRARRSRSRFRLRHTTSRPSSAGESARSRRAPRR